MSSSEESVPKPSSRRWAAVLTASGVIAAVATVVAVVSIVVVVVVQDDETPADRWGDCEVAELDEDLYDGADHSPMMSQSGAYLAFAGDPVTLWQDGESSEIDDESLSVLDVNSSGMVVGSRGPYDMGDNGTPWVYQDGEVEDLPVPDEAEDVVVYALGDDGTIVGEIDTSTAEEEEEDNGDRMLVVWKPGESEPTVLDDANSGEFVSVTEDGDILGTKGREPWKWDADGDGEALAAVPEREIDDDDKDSDTELSEYGDTLYDGEVVDVSGDWVLVKSHAGDFYRWSFGGMPSEIELDSATAIDAQGRVYGNTARDVTAVKTDEGGAELPAPDEDFYEMEVVDVNQDGGFAIGRVTVETETESTSMYFTWTCS